MEHLTDNELVMRVRDKHLFPLYQEDGFLYTSIAAGLELDKRAVLIPNIVEHERNWNSYACSFCGTGFQAVDIKSMRNHFEGEVCVNGFNKDRQCCCKKKFSTLDEAHGHYRRLNCKAYFKEQERKRLIKEEKYKANTQKRVARQAEYNCNRTIYGRCELCNTDYQSITHKTNHEEGIRHTEALQGISLHCKTCDVLLESKKKYGIHCLTKKHIKLSNQSS